MVEREFRVLSFVPRWSIGRTIRHQSVAEHSFYVALYTHQLCMALGVENNLMNRTIQAALYEDLDEILTGDIPGPSKRSIVTDKEHAYKWYGDSLEDRFGMQTVQFWWYAKAAEAKSILKVANLMDEVAHLATELQGGNKMVMPMYEDSHSRLMEAAKQLGQKHGFAGLPDVLAGFASDHLSGRDKIPSNNDDIKIPPQHDPSCMTYSEAQECTCGAEPPY